MIAPRGFLRTPLVAAILTGLLAGCLVQNPKPDPQAAISAPEESSSQDSTTEQQQAPPSETNADEADITITVTPQNTLEAANDELDASVPSIKEEQEINRLSDEVDQAIADLYKQPSTHDSPTQDSTKDPLALPSITPSTEPAPPVTGKAAEQADAPAELPEPTEKDTPSEQVVQEPNHSVEDLCDEIGNKLGSVSVNDCLALHLVDSGARSRLDRSLAIKEYPQVGEKQSGRVLLMGGIHGDEFSSVSIIFKWLKFIHQEQAHEFTWQVVPLLNPDGLLRSTSQRQNDSGVDLNRNFPSPDWQADAHSYWKQRTGSNPRRYPGPKAASEPETQWFIELIEEFNPDAIVAVHAPHSLVDYDGPQKPPNSLGKLRLHELGIYPGSLGNYAGVYKNIPVVTIELTSAGIMPSRTDISHMWDDLIVWLQKEVPKQRLARTESDTLKQKN